MGRQPLKVIVDRYSRGGSRVEPGQSSLMQGDLVIEADKLHQHARNQDNQIAWVRKLVALWQQLHRGLGRSRALGQRTLCLRVRLLLLD